MEKYIISFLILILVATGFLVLQKDNTSNEKCCTACSKNNQVKYYSVVTDNNRCGECCLNPKVFWLFKIFEKNLTLAEEKTCASLGYPNYENTQTHGFFPVKVTLDMYTK